MRRSLAVALVSICAVLAGPAAARAAYPRTPAQCAQALDCAAAEINLMTMSDRLAFVQAMERGPGARFGAQSRWHNIQGVITFFRDHQWGPSDTWVSFVDAGIVEGIERGLAIALGRPGGDYGNPGAPLWADYVTKLRSGQLRDRGRHDRAWGIAEQASTDRGVYLAEVVHGIPPSDVEQRFYDFSQLYREIMRTKPEAAQVTALYGVFAAQPEVTFRSNDFVDWFTDVGNVTPSRLGCEMAFRFASLDIWGGIGGAIDLFLAFIPDMFRQYLADQQRVSAPPTGVTPAGRKVIPTRDYSTSRRARFRARAAARDAGRRYVPRHDVRIPRALLRQAAPALTR